MRFYPVASIPLSEGFHFLRTKLFIPRKRTDLVARPLLVERIYSRLDRKLTLISAPAGFGKTTLLSEWVSTCPRRVTWLFLDEGDNDPSQFWTYLFAYLQGLHSDQSGMIGLVRRLHGLGITILELQIIPEGGKAGKKNI